MASRTRLRIETPDGPRWIFCWVVNEGRIATTEDPRKAIEHVGDNLQYFQNKTAARVWPEQIS